LIPHGPAETAAGVSAAGSSAGDVIRDVIGVTVVMATRDRRDGAMRALGQLHRLPEAPSVIVVDDGSTDGTADAVRAAFPDVMVLRRPCPAGVTAARNVGVRAATTPYVAFSDDDSWWAPGALLQARRHFAAQPRLGLLAARILVGTGQELDPTCAAMADSPLPADGLPGPRVLGFVACGAVVRRAAYLAVGGFPEDYIIGGEEEPLALALAAEGWDVAYLDDVVAHHHPGTVSRNIARRRSNLTRNALWTAWRHRRAAGALRETAAILAEAVGDPARLAGVGEALRRLPTVLRSRRPVPAAVEAHRRLLSRSSAAHQDRQGHDAEGAGGPVPAAWLAAVARRRAERTTALIVAHHRSSARQPVEQRLAVVVITRDRAPELVANLQRLAMLPERPHALVVDNASSDGTAAAVLAAHPEVELLVLDRNAGAVGRNLAVALLDHPYIAFADDDTWWEPGSLQRAADVLDANPDVAVVTARILVEPDGREDPVVADMRRSPLTQDPRLPGRPLLSFLAGASVVRRDAFSAVGGFEPRLHIGGEEELLSADLLAAGWQLRYIPELTVHHAPSRTRDAHRRRADGLRNTLWCTWLRRPWPRAVWRSAALLRRIPRDRVSALGVVEAVRGLPWVLRERHLLPAAVEQQYRLLDRTQLDSPARRYVS